MSQRIGGRIRDVLGGYREGVQGPGFGDHKWHNIAQAARRRGSFLLPGGVRVPFTQESKPSRIALLRFALREGVTFSARNQGWTVNTESDEIVTPEGIRFCLDSFHELIFSETFVHDAHFVDFAGSGRTVVEAGAFVGDTALYYARRGFRVYSFEPDRRNYAFLLRNLALNPGLSSNVFPHRCALGKEGTVTFHSNWPGGGSTVRSESGTSEVVESLSLKSVLERTSIRDPYLLHLDVKGNEYDLVEEREVGLFQRVRLEYVGAPRGQDRRGPSYLVQKLQDHGFDHIRLFKHNASSAPIELHGTIDAMKA